MSHWQMLELTPDADQRSIKRAYARLLKQYRPDEDPEAFQRLREAYEASLEEARWREQVEHVAPVTDATLPDSEPSAPFAMPGTPAQLLEPALAECPPEPPLEQLHTWLAEGKERQVMDALRLWLASDWLLPFERREQFEQSVLALLESDAPWSPAFFEGVCQAMGWDEAQGNLPCDYWRWDRFIHRCELHAMEENLRNELARHRDDKVLGQPAALLLAPMSDSKRRVMADGFSGHDWQRFTQFAHAIEDQHPDLPERLGLTPLDNWRDWLPAVSYRPVFVFLWLALSLVILPSLITYTKTKGDLAAMLVIPLFVPGVLFLGMKLYRLVSMVVLPMASIDVPLSRWLLPHRLYRQGAGLLLLRHVLPALVPAGLALAWAGNVTWLRWCGPALVFLGTLYFTNAVLRGGKLAIWDRVARAVKARLGRLPWHLLRREGVLIALAVIAMGLWVYMRSRH